MFKKLCILVAFICLLCALAGCTGEEPKEGSSMEVSFILEVSGEESKEESKLPDESDEVSEDSSALPDESDEVSEDSSALPDESDEVSEDSSALPEESEEVSEESSTLPDESDETSSEDGDNTDNAVYHRDPNKPNDKTPVVVPKDFPALSKFEDGSAKKQEFSYFFTEYFIVVKITDEGFYGASPYSYRANVFVFGDYGWLSLGDYVGLAGSSYWLYLENEGKSFFAFPKEAFAGVWKLDWAEIYDLYEFVDAPEKPVIYLYPEEETVVSVRLDYKGDLTCTYPHYQNGKGWENLTVSPDGTIRKDGKEFYCLYWEGRGTASYDFSKGFCVKGEDSAAFLEEILPKMGLNAREANEFIIYWLPRLEANPYNVISFQQDAYTETAPLEVSPTPDSMLRVFMAFYGSDSYVEMAPQEFEGFERKGFVLVEWGGAELRR